MPSRDLGQLETGDGNAAMPAECNRDLPQVLVFTRLHKASRPVQSIIWDMLAQRKVVYSRQGRQYTNKDPLDAADST